MRLRILDFLIGLIFIFLVCWLFGIQIIKGSKFSELSDKNCIRLIPQEGKRGDILDRNGNVLVGSTISYDLVVLPQELENLDKTLVSLSSITGLTFKELKDRFKKNYLSPNMPVVLIKDLDRQRALLLEEIKVDLDGVIVQPRPVRHYPYGSLACHIIGYLSQIDQWRLNKLDFYGYKIGDIVGYGGIEEKYDFYLRQENGGISQEVDHKGRMTRLLGYKPPKSGKDIQLTVDLRVQKIVEQSLEDRKGAVVIMDPNNGEIIAMASGPGFEPSVFVRKKNQIISSLYRDSSAPLFNRAIGGVYPPGSVFKVVDASAGLELGKISPYTTYYCPGSLAVGRRNFKCWGTHYDQNLNQAITHSCDVYFYKVGLLVGPVALHDFALKFGLSKQAGIEIPYEQSGLVPNPMWKQLYKFQSWYDGDTANFAIGQGALLTSPLQLARVMAVFANGGYLVTPYIIQSVDGRDVSLAHRKISSLHFRPNTLEIIAKGLRSVVQSETGTANILSSMPVSVAGKTGTAETTGGTHAWFVGFFPYEKPKFVISAFLEKGGHGYASCILTKQIIELMFQEGLL